MLAIDTTSSKKVWSADEIFLEIILQRHFAKGAPFIESVPVICEIPWIVVKRYGYLKEVFNADKINYSLAIVLFLNSQEGLISESMPTHHPLFFRLKCISLQWLTSIQLEWVDMAGPNVSDGLTINFNRQIFILVF